MSMIARVAESCFWMCRYMERVESTARLLAVNRSLVMSVHIAPERRWRPMTIVVGEEPGFLKRHGAAAFNNAELVQRDLTWAPECPVSIATSLRWARENARTSRETISQETWRCLNGFWLWLNSDAAQVLYDTRRHDFYQYVVHQCQHFQGVLHGTMMRQQPYDFMRLGLYLERAGQTARLLDVHEHLLARDVRDTPTEEHLFWSAVLRSCSGYDMFLKNTRRPRLRGADVFAFLVARSDFPRAVLYGLVRSRALLKGLRPPARPEIGARAFALSDELVTSVEALNTRDAIDDAHKHLTWIVDTTARLCDAISEEYFHLRVLPQRSPDTTIEHDL